MIKSDLENLRIPQPVSVCHQSNFAVRGVLHDVVLLTLSYLRTYTSMR